MDTPDRSKISTPLSKFEDSPVFNYINSLSPIKPVKSTHITQTFNSLNFSSPPSVFTSPHVTCHKETRFLRRHNLLDTSKAKVSEEDVNKVDSNEEAPKDSTDACQHSSELKEKTDQGISVGDASIELPQVLKYNSGSPGYAPLLCGDDANSLLELPGGEASDVTYVHDGSTKDSVEGEVHLQGMRESEPKIEGPESPDCDWGDLITDASDMLMFTSPNVTASLKGLMNKQSDHSIQYSNFMTSVTQSTTNNGPKMHIGNAAASGLEHEIEDHPSEPITATDTVQKQENFANAGLMASNPSEKMDAELVYVTHRGIRRRCLDFEMASVRRKNSDNNSNTSCSTAKSDRRSVNNENQLLPTKHISDSRRCVLPAIGLHLNALASIKDCKSSGRQCNTPSSSSSLLITTSQEVHPLALVPSSVERDLDPSENEVQPTDDCSQSSAYVAGEDFQQNSPKKKRSKLEPIGESESCKRCNCKKSKCLKLYCECFAAGVYCIEPCSCQDCFNKPIHVDMVLQTRKQIESRNPLAFAPKVIRSADSVAEIGDDPNKTPASARHKRGCNCKKSSCLKKYCECFQGGVGCSISCRCEGCKNAFGRKDGSVPTEVEAEQEEETEACEKGAVEKASQKTETQNIEDNPESALPTTPLRLSRSLLPLPFSSKGKPPRSFVATISGSGLFTTQKLGKATATLSSRPKFEKPFQTVPDDEMPDVIGGDSSPITCIKTSSPNGKRISSPNCDHLGSSPARRGSRKLILQSIPSFPSLTPHH